MNPFPASNVSRSHLLRWLPLLFGCASLGMALLLLIGDGLFARRYGMGYSDVAFVTAEGIPAEWPTGQRPAWAVVPLSVHSLWFVLLAAVVLSLHPPPSDEARAKSRGGTE